jgi:hypothetical protein
MAMVWLLDQTPVTVTVTAVAARLLLVSLDLIANQTAHSGSSNGAHGAAATENGACDAANDGSGCSAFFATRHMAASAQGHRGRCNDGN